MDVLDKGYVKLVDIMGNDWTPVEAARVSYNAGLKGEEQDTKLMKYLLRNGHTSPFEMVEIMWEVKAPIFVARQWVRHRTANWNEVSARYTEVDEFYIPDKWRGQDTKNKQGSVGTAFTEEDYYVTCLRSLETYRGMLRDGVSREMARMVLPQSMYTKWVWKNDLHNTLRFLKLREDDHAQWEIQQYAKAMRTQLEEKLPTLMSVWYNVEQERG